MRSRFTSGPERIRDYGDPPLTIHYRKTGVTILQPGPDARSAPASRRIRRRTLQAVVTVATVGMIAATTWFLRAPDRTFEVGYGIELKRGIGDRIWTVLEHGQTAAPGTIEIEGINPNITSDGAAVKVEYAICHLDPAVLAAEGVSSSGYGMHDHHVRRYCTRLAPVEAASMQLGTKPGQELLVGVTPTRPGRSIIRSHLIEFSEGWRQGTAKIHASVDIRAR